MRTIRLKNWPNPSIAFSQPSENNSKFALIDYDNVFIGGCLHLHAAELDAVLEHETMPKPGGESALRLDLSMSRIVWGDWEPIRFDYRVVNTAKQPVDFEDGDSGRGFAGKVMYLRDPQRKIRSFGSHWAEPKQYAPNFHGRTEKFDSGATVYEQTRMEPANFFGDFGNGKHAVQVVVPVGRMAINGDPIQQLASRPVEFQVVTLTPALRRTMETTPKDDAGVSLEPVARSIATSKIGQAITMRLTNNSAKSIYFSKYINDKLSPTTFEVFAGSGKWIKGPVGWCGSFLGAEELAPKKTATITTYSPTDTGRYFRITIEVNDKGSKKTRTIVSRVIEIVDDKKQK